MQIYKHPKCRNQFHRDCLGKWLETHETCPICRDKIQDFNTVVVVAPKKLYCDWWKQAEYMNHAILYAMVHILQKKWTASMFAQINKVYLKKQLEKITVRRADCWCHPDLNDYHYKIKFEDWMITDYTALCDYYWNIRPKIKEMFYGSSENAWLLEPVQHMAQAIMAHPEFLAFRQRYPWN